MPSRNTRSTDRAADRIALDCLAVRVRLLNRTITSIYDDALRPLGLTAGQLNILVVIAKRGPISPSEVARRLNMEKSTVSRNIARIRNNGWVDVTAGKSGHRQVLTLNSQGEHLLEKSLPAWEKAQSKTGAVLGHRGAQSIHSIGNAVWNRLVPD